MTLDEAIKTYTSNAEYERTHGNLQGCLDFKQLADWLKELKQLREQEPCEDAISRQAAQAKIKSICYKYRLSYEDGERKPATGGSAYALGHAFDDLPPVTQQGTYANIPFLLHKEFGCPLDECVKAYEKANEYLRSKSKLKG